MHEGHRQRMFDRLSNGSKLEDHELLEVLLYFVLPRVNTNEIAHALLNAFGNLNAVFDAAPDKLMKVKGVGTKTALFIHLIGLFLKRVQTVPSVTFPHAYSFTSFSEFLGKRFRGLKEEVAELYAVKKNGELIFCKRFTSEELFMVEIPVSEITSFIASFNPKEVILVHNHVDGGCQPSREDNFFTKKLYLYLDMCGVRLLDHYIVGPHNIYSYEHEGRMEEIRRTCTAENLLKKSF